MFIWWKLQIRECLSVSHSQSVETSDKEVQALSSRMDFMKSRRKTGKPRVGQKCRQRSGGEPMSGLLQLFLPLQPMQLIRQQQREGRGWVRITKGNLETVVPNPIPDISFSVGLEEDEELAFYQLLYCALSQLGEKIVTGHVPENQLPPFLLLPSLLLPSLPLSSPSLPISLSLSHQFSLPLFLSLKAHCNFPVH